MNIQGEVNRLLGYTGVCPSASGVLVSEAGVTHDHAKIVMVAGYAGTKYEQVFLGLQEYLELKLYAIHFQVKLDNPGAFRVDRFTFIGLYRSLTKEELVEK